MRNVLTNTLFSINDSLLLGGINYKQQVNNGNDLMFGVVAAASIKFTIDNSSADADKYLNGHYRWYCDITNSGNLRYRGTYIISDIVKDGQKATLSGYDLVSLLDIDIAEWLNNKAFPCTLAELAVGAATQCGLTIDTAGVADFTVNQNFLGVNITARQILGYIAQLSNCFVVAGTADKDLVFKTYRAVDKPIDNSKYTALKLNDYLTPEINRVQIQATEADLGYIAGNGDNTYIIRKNPLCFTTEAAETVQALAANILSTIGDITYTGGEFSALNDFEIECGDVVKVNGADFYVMAKEQTASGCTFSCYGQAKREVKAAAVNTDLVILNNKTNELTRSLDETKSTITKISGDMETVTTQSTEIKQTVDNITISAVKNVDSTIMQLSSGGKLIGDAVTVDNGVSAAASATIAADAVNGITLDTSVNGNTATLTLKNGTTTIDSGSIVFNGLVTFNDLSTQGKTTINGANIQAGTIDASALYVDQVFNKSNKKCVIDCSSAGNIYIGGSTSTNSVNNVYIKANTQVLVGKWGDNSGFIFDTSTTAPKLYCGYNTLASLGSSTKPFGSAYIKDLYIRYGSTNYIYGHISLSNYVLECTNLNLGTAAKPVTVGYFTNLYVNGKKVTV